MVVKNNLLKQRLKEKFGLKDSDFIFRQIARGRGSEAILYALIYDFEYEGHKFTYEERYEAVHLNYNDKTKFRLFSEQFGILNPSNSRTIWIETLRVILNEKEKSIRNIISGTHSSKYKCVEYISKNNPFDILSVNFPYAIFSEKIPLEEIMNFCKTIQDKIEENAISIEEFNSLAVEDVIFRFNNKHLYDLIVKTFSKDLFV